MVSTDSTTREGIRFDAGFEELRAVGGLKWSQHPDAIGAFVAEMDFGVAPVVADAVRASVEGGLTGYLTTSLVTRLAEAWTGFAQERFGWDVPTERVRPVGDVVAGLEAAIQHYSRPGSPVILPTPAYMPFLDVPGELGREVLQVPLAREGDRWVYDLDALDAAYRQGGDLLVLVNPHNPTGRVLTREELLAIAEVVDRHGGRVFSDEIHAPLVHAGHRHVPYASVDPTMAAHTLTAVSASKAWNVPGLKCAQLVFGSDEDLARWGPVGLRPEHGASIPGVVANVTAYEDGGPWLEEVLDHLAGNVALLGDLLAEHLPEVAWAAPEGTYLAWLDCRALGLGDHPAEHFLRHARVALTDGTLCGEVGAGWVRHNVATPRAILRDSVERMAASLPPR